MMNKQCFCLMRLITFTVAMTTVIVAATAETNNAFREFKPKKLTSDKMFLLNEAMGMNPVCILRIDLTNRAALATLKALDVATDGKDIFSQKMGAILEPLKQFFDVIQQYSFMVRPLVEESLFGKEAATHASAEQRAKFVKDSLLLQFFESKSNDVVNFFEKHIACKEDLKKACSEVLIFFADLKSSLSDATMQQYRAFITELKKPKVKK